jgi:hypothetical protein
MSATAVALALAMLSHPRLAAGSKMGPARELWLNNVQAADFVRIVLEQYWMPDIGKRVKWCSLHIPRW